MRDRRDADALLQAIGVCVFLNLTGKTHFLTCCVDKRRARATSAFECPFGIVQRASIADGVECAIGAHSCSGKLKRFGQPDCPSDQRGKSETDHHRLDHPVRGHEHAPRRKIMRQRSIRLTRLAPLHWCNRLHDWRLGYLRFLHGRCCNLVLRRWSHIVLGIGD